MVVVAMVAK